MTSLDIGLITVANGGRAGSSSGFERVDALASKACMPKGLYARALIIIIAPMVVLQSVVAFVFMERHWNTVTRRLSAARGRRTSPR